MRKWLLVCGLLVVLTIFMAGCDEVPADDSSGESPDAEVMSVPTRTVKPIVSFTPRFTATPIPSMTLTPSDTPLPTDTTLPPTTTPTLTPSPTATIEGIIRSTENVNLRSGPGFNNPVVLSLSPGTSLGVIGRVTDDRGVTWYKVAFEDEDGNPQRLWVSGSLLETKYDQQIGAASEVSPDETEESEATRTPGPTPEPNRVEILAYCRQKNVRPASPTTNDNVYIEWSWYVARQELMDQHLENGMYEVRLDGELLDDWEQYATEMKLEQGVWIIYWFYPVGKLDAGEHSVEFSVTWDEAITDGYEQFGPGTPNEIDQGDCTFTVTEP